MINFEDKVNELRSEAKMCGYDLSKISDEKLIEFALNFLIANVLDAFYDEEE